MPKLTIVERAFPEGLKYAYRLAVDETRHDIEDLMERLKDATDEIRSELDVLRSERAGLRQFASIQAMTSSQALVNTRAAVCGRP